MWHLHNQSKTGDGVSHTGAKQSDRAAVTCCRCYLYHVRALTQGLDGLGRGRGISWVASLLGCERRLGAFVGPGKIVVALHPVDQCRAFGRVQAVQYSRLGYLTFRGGLAS